VITRVPGVTAGHFTDSENHTGCTVLLFDPPAVGGVDVRGGSPGTHQTDLLRPEFRNHEVHGLVFSGGSAWGLQTASGVMRFLAEQGKGLAMPIGRIPIVPAAILFDMGAAVRRPNADDGYRAAAAASSAPLAEGPVGAGTGATVGKLLGLKHRSPGGVGVGGVEWPDGTIVAALAAVNAFGDVIGADGEIIAGTRDPSGTGFYKGPWPPPGYDPRAGFSTPESGAGNTTLVAVVTNAPLTKGDCTRLAIAAQDGISRAVKPAHTAVDGDAVFAFTLGKGAPPDHFRMATLGAAAADAVSEAIRRAVGPR
jgi:L-aminopeptidase/D-esterase-like protein